MRRAISAIAATLVLGTALLAAPTPASAALAAAATAEQAPAAVRVQQLMRDYDYIAGYYERYADCDSKGLEGINKHWWVFYYCYYNVWEYELRVKSRW